MAAYKFWNPDTSEWEYLAQGPKGDKGDDGADGSGSGDVVGPDSSTDNTLPRFDSTTGKLIQGSGVVVDDNDNVTMGKLLLINATSGNPEFDFQESGTTRGKVYYDVTNNRLTFQNNENNSADALYFADPATFTSFPTTPSSAPTADYHVANKKYVDDNAGGGGLTGFFDVTAYGAVGDDSTDDTAAIQDAIDAAWADGGGVVWFPNGVYKIQTNPLKIYAGTTAYEGIVLIGQSTRGTTIKQYTTGVDIIQGLNDASDEMQTLNCGIERMTLLFGGTSTNSGNGVYLKQGEADGPSFQQFHMKDVIIQDCKGSGKYGFNAESIIVAYLDNVLVQDGSGGFFLNGGANSSDWSSVNTSTTLRNCYSNGNSGIGYHIKMATYVHLDNTACDAEDGTEDGYFIDQCASVVLTAPGFENGNTYSGYMFHIANVNQFVVDGGFGFGNTNILMNVTGSKGVINAFRNETDDSSATVGLLVGSGSEVWDMGSDWSGADTPVSVNAAGRYYTPGVTRVQSASNPSSITPNSGAQDEYRVVSLGGALTINAPSGTAQDSQKLIIRIKDNGTTRTLTWNSIYRAIGVTLPTATTAGKTHYIGMIYNITDTKWDVVAVGVEA